MPKFEYEGGREQIFIDLNITHGIEAGDLTLVASLSAIPATISSWLSKGQLQKRHKKLPSSCEVHGGRKAGRTVDAVEIQVSTGSAALCSFERITKCFITK